MVRFVALLALAVLLSTVPVEARRVPPRIRQASFNIAAIDMDGALFAYDVTARHAPNSPCNKVFVWNVKTGHAARVSGNRTCEADDTSTGAGVAEVAVAGQRVAWIVNLGGLTESGDFLYTASLPRPREKPLAGALRTGDIDGVLTGDWLGGLVGDGDLLAVNAWRTGSAGEVTAASLRRIRSLRLTTVAAGTETLRAVAADTGRIAVARDDGTVGLYAAAGGLLRTVAPSSVKEVALRADRLAVLTTANTLAIYNANTGATVKTLPVAAGAFGLDVHAGMAVYAAGTRVHLLRLSDGRSAVLARAPGGIVGVEIEAPGIVYAYNRRDVGHLVFVPLAKARSRLT